MGFSGSQAGLAGRDLPEEFGKWSPVFRKFRRWTLVRLWEQIGHALNEIRLVPAALHMVDSTLVRAPSSGSGRKKRDSATGFLPLKAVSCAFRRIRLVVPTTSGQGFRSIRPSEGRCRTGMVFDVRLFGLRQLFRRGCPAFASNDRRVRGDGRCGRGGRGSHRQSWVRRSRRAML